MISKKFAGNVVCWGLAISSATLLPAISEPQKQVKAQTAAVRQIQETPAFTEDQARMLVKEIPLVNIGTTLGRWAFSEPELAKLRQWSQRLVGQPGGSDFLPQWAELVPKAKVRNPGLQNADVVHLIQMLMSAAYEEANKNLDSLQGRSKFYKEMEGRINENLTNAGRLQVLVRPQLNDSAAGALIRLPAYERVLQSCEEQTGPPPRLDCREVPIATTMQLDDYVETSTKQLQQARENARKAELDLQNRRQKRLQMLEALSETARLMVDATRKGTH